MLQPNAIIALNGKVSWLGMDLGELLGREQTAKDSGISHNFFVSRARKMEFLSTIFSFVDDVEFEFADGSNFIHFL